MDAIRIRRFQPTAVFQWLSCGWRLLRRHPLEALRPAAVFALATILLLNIPIVGSASLLLLLPINMASYIVHAHLLAHTGNKTPPASKSTPVYLRWARELQWALFGACAKSVNLFSLIAVGIAMATLGLVSILLFKTVGGQGVLKTVTFFELTWMQMIQVLLAYGVVSLFWAVIAGMGVWSLPLLILRDMELGDALRWSLRGFKHNAAATIVFALLFAACLWPGLLVQPWLPTFFHVVQWLLLAFSSALFGFSAYCSYRLVFAETESAARPAAPRPPMGQIPPSTSGSIPKLGSRTS